MPPPAGTTRTPAPARSTRPSVPRTSTPSAARALPGAGVLAPQRQLVPHAQPAAARQHLDGARIVALVDAGAAAGGHHTHARAGAQHAAVRPANLDAAGGVEVRGTDGRV